MDLEGHNTQLVSREFLAVILSGIGEEELSPLTSDHGDEPVPKALLPIANKPLLHYTLSWLEQSGITYVLLICPLSHRAAISHYIHSDPSFSSLRINIQPFDESPDRIDGACSLLRHFSSHIQEDFILLPVDFIPPPSLPLLTLLNKFRIDSTSDGSIATTCWFEVHRPEKGGIADEWGPPPKSTAVVWDEKTMTMLFIDTPDDLDRDAEYVNLSMSLLTLQPRARLSASLQDSHVYVCKRSVLEALHAKPHFESLKEDFFPWLCKIQSQRSKREKYSRVLNPDGTALSQSLAMQHSTLRGEGLESRPSSTRSFARPSDTVRSMPTSPTGPDAFEGDPASLRIGFVIHRAKDGFAARVNNVHVYLETNRHFLSQPTYALQSDPVTRSLIDQKAQISADSMIGDSTRIGEKTNVKKSVIGRHCVVGKMVKLSGCVIMDHCVVADGAKLEGCVLGKSTKVGAKAELVRCISQAGYEVDAGETLKNEKLEILDWTGTGDEESGLASS